MENKQLFEKQANSYNPIYPLVRLEDIMDTISDKSIQWIINNYNHIYVEYSESREITRNKVPQLLRRSGLWISYNNGKKNVTEYYIGENTNVNNYVEWTFDDNWKEFDELNIQDGSITYQHLSDALKQLVAGGNTITNFPDEEDITTDGTVLSFKDRNYEPNKFSGLGRVILRKNIKKINEGKYINVLTQSMIDKENTIYEIRYDFDLNGAEITVPEGCVLDFQGGSLNNGIVVGIVTQFASNPRFYNVNFEGTYKIDVIDSSWIEDVNSTNRIKSLFKLTNGDYNNQVIIRRGDYYVKALSVNDNIINLNDNTTVIIDGNIYIEPNPFIGYRMFFAQNKKNIKIEGSGKLIGDKEEHDYTEEGTHEFGHAICIYQSQNVEISGLEIQQFTGDCISIANISDMMMPNNINIHDCKLHDSRRQGISLVSVNNCIVYNCEIYNIKGTLPGSAVDIEPNKNGSSYNILLENLYVHNCYQGLLVLGLGALESDIYDIKIERCRVEHCLAEHLRIRGYNVAVESSYINIPNITTTDVYEGGIVIDTGNAYIKNTIINNMSETIPMFYANSDNLVIENCNLTSKSYIYDSYGTFIVKNSIIDAAISVCKKNQYNRARTELYNNSINGIFFQVEKTFICQGNRIKANVNSKPVIYSDASCYYVNISNNIFSDADNIFVDWFIRFQLDINTGYIKDNQFNFGDNNASGCIFIGGKGWDVIGNVFNGIPVDMNMHAKNTENYNTMLTKIPKVSNSLPTLGFYDRGNSFFYTELNKPVWWTGNKWVDATGAEV